MAPPAKTLSTSSAPSPTSPFIRADLKDVSYNAVESPDLLAEELHLHPSLILKLNANENSYGCIGSVTAAGTAALTSSCHVYPDPTGPQSLRKSIATTFGSGCSVDQVVVGAGSDDMLEVLLRVTGASRVIISTPTFGMYAFLARQYGVTIRDIPRNAEPGFELDVAGIIAAAAAPVRDGDHSPAIVFIATPNNPTGTVTPSGVIAQLCEALEKQAIIVADEAYVDFIEHLYPSSSTLLSTHPNLVIIRTFSKWAGLAGIRLGFAICGSVEISRAMLSCRQPYNVNVVAAACGQQAITSRDSIMTTVRALYSTMEELRRQLSSPDFRSMFDVIPGHANFVLCRVKDRKAEDVYKQLRSLGVMIRFFGSQGGALHDHVRISSPRTEDLPRLLRTLNAVKEGGVVMTTELTLLKIQSFQPSAILFDMDGVIVDVSQSYRKAIVDTCRSFNVTVTDEDVHKVKAGGNANNDWIVTHRLITTHSTFSSSTVTPTFEQVKAKFEDLYQGDSMKSGLWEDEKLLIKKSQLQTLSQRYPLGIVTGRPRTPDCDRFLDYFGIRQCFSVIVCAEDTPELKPSPQPVQLACRQLGNPSKVIFLGDTVDDIRAGVATGSHVFPLGVLLPSTKTAAKDVGTLMTAGAKGVVSAGCGELFHALLTAGVETVTGKSTGAQSISQSTASVSAVGSSTVTPSSIPQYIPSSTKYSTTSSTIRTATVDRQTLETKITVTITIDGEGSSSISTGIGYFDHMLSALAKHSRMDIMVKCIGDTHIDDHHTVEDVCLSVGKCLKRAIGERRGIRRYGSAYCPLDDALARGVVDVSGRPFACVDLCMTREQLGTMSCEMLGHGLESLISAAKLTCHITVLTPSANNHHKAEAAFKAFAVSLRGALAWDQGAGVPSTKGVL